MVLDETLMGPSVTTGLKENTVILINTSEPKKYEGLVSNRIVTIDATTLALEILGRPITNTAMMGALVAISGAITIEEAKKAIESSMNPKIVDKNKKLVEKAYNIVKEA